KSCAVRFARSESITITKQASCAISKMDTYTGLQNRLKLVTNNQVELNKATEDTFRIAQKTYSAWDSVLQVYQRFSDNAKT
ncbi:tape measure protein, partial [Acinetobacter baumannii]